MSNFSDLGLNRQICDAVEQMGYSEPTSIQKKSIPIILNGQHVIGIAPTGTGKTAAFVLPILRKLNYAQGDIPRCVIFLPTKELAHQVYEKTVEFAANTDLRAVKLIGGAGIVAQRNSLSEGCDIIIATPGRFFDLYRDGHIVLKQIQIMVLDEADKMMDMGFLPQLNQILEVLPRKKQHLLFSATFHEKVEALSADFLDFPVKIEVKQEARTVNTVHQQVYHLPNYKTKCNLLLHLLEEESLKKVLVFCRTKETAGNLEKFLSRKNVGEWRVIHANKDQNTRLKAYKDFQADEVRGLVTTDIAARGIDIEDISHVINFELPVMYEEYIHRVGRTGRAKKQGTCISFTSPVEKYHFAKIEELIGLKVENLAIPSSVEVEDTSKEERQNYNRELDRLKQKDNPEYKGAFHERKGANKKGINKRALKAYKFAKSKKKRKK